MYVKILDNDGAISLVAQSAYGSVNVLSALLGLELCAAFRQFPLAEQALFKKK